MLKSKQGFFKRLVTSAFAMAALSLNSTTAMAEEDSSSKLFNVKTAPISYLIGIRNVEVDVKLFDSWTVGPSYYDFKFTFDNNDYEINGWGLRGNYYFGEALSSGVYLAGMATFSEIEIHDERYVAELDRNVDLKAEASFNVYTALLGYQWHWDYFNISLGAGVGIFTLPSTVVAVDDDYSYDFDTAFVSGVLPAGEFQMGLAF